MDVFLRNELHFIKHENAAPDWRAYWRAQLEEAITLLDQSRDLETFLRRANPRRVTLKKIVRNMGLALLALLFCVVLFGREIVLVIVVIKCALGFGCE